MRSIYKWLANRSRREVLAFVGTTVSAILGALWTGYLHFREHEKPKPPAELKMETSYRVCIGQYPYPKGSCPQGSTQITCGSSVEAWPLRRVAICNIS